MKKVFILFILLTSIACAKEEAPIAENELIEIVEPNIIEHNLVSTIVNDEYPIQVYIPQGLINEVELPVIYVLDGITRFKVIQELVDELKINAMVVGIANNEMRDRDYMPENTCAEGGGGYNNYYNFLIQELIPFIDANYNTDQKNRTLVGHSFSGAMALIALFLGNAETPIINSFIANDPSILCEPDFFNGLLPSNDGATLNPTIKLHISKSYQNTYHLFDFGERLESEAYNWLDLDWEEFKSHNHSNILEPSFKAGLEFIFN